ncbi:MAG: ribonuclease H-like domain-containing protein [Clostridium sp.]|nr:ribonuclease H-like domain-containing protein [Clostridium sp.]
MLLNEKESKLILNEKMIDKYSMIDMAYFDIETTGFDKEDDIIMLISIGWFVSENTFHVKQYYADNKSEEKDVLKKFKKDIDSYEKWCSYNGKAFDEPFINHRMIKNNINNFIAPKEHVDLYRLIRPYYKELGLKRCNLKSVEKYIGINRLDKIDGGVSVELYKRYLRNKDKDLRKTIMLHNYEDVLNLPKIFKVVFSIDTSSEIVRDDGITEKQLSYMKYLLKKNRVDVAIELNKMSKKAASRVIDSLIKGSFEEKDLNDIIDNSY